MEDDSFRQYELKPRLEIRLIYNFQYLSELMISLLFSASSADFHNLTMKTLV